MANEKEIVKYDNRWHVLDKVSSDGIATLLRNGEATLVPIKLIKRKERK